jgi:hypothetical protein
MEYQGYVSCRLGMELKFQHLNDTLTDRYFADRALTDGTLAASNKTLNDNRVNRRMRTLRKNVDESAIPPYVERETLDSAS